MSSHKNLVILPFVAAGLLCASLSSPTIFASSNTRNAISDSAITMSIKGKMAKEPIVSSTAITVETNDGIVTLSGNAKSDEEACRVTELAESTEGVKDVRSSNLSVEGSDQSLTDSIITAKVKGIFVREKIFGDKPISVTGISVETKDGVVHLDGQVKNKKQADNAVHLARSIAGVKSVVSHIKIRS